MHASSPRSGDAPSQRVLYHRARRKRLRRLRLGLAAGLLAMVAAIAWLTVSAFSGGSPERAVAAEPAAGPSKPAARAATPPQGAINPDYPGITTFRGNLTRTYHGEGPVPRKPRIRWRYPSSGGMCAPSSDETGTTNWCGVGWTGQPNVIPRKNGGLELRFGAYDTHYHFLNARTGKPIRPDLDTGDLAKGSATSDPDGYPLYYAGSRDNLFRIIALDRPRPTVLWTIDGDTSVDQVWNNDWDGAALVVGDYLLEGGENSWFYVVKLNRGYDPKTKKVRVRPKIVLTVPSWDSELWSSWPSHSFSIENSVAFHEGVAYFANSAGLVQGWDISRILEGGKGAKRVFRYWTGDDTDASIVIDEQGYLYVASELEKFDSRSRRVGQLIKLNPKAKSKPRVWGVPLRRIGEAGKGGSWSTPALDRQLVYVATNAGGLVAVSRKTGAIRWRIPLPGPTWASPVVVDNVLLQGDCSGVLHAFDVRNQQRAPRELWSIKLGGCIEATPAVWRGWIWVGTRGGAMYGIH